MLKITQSIYFSLVIYGAVSNAIYNTPLGAVVFFVISVLGIEIELNV